METVDRWVERIIYGLQGIALLTTFVLMVLTLADVVGRYFLKSSIRGAYEVTQILLATIIFAGLPIATAGREHIVIDLLDAIVPAGLKRPQAFMVDVISVVVLGVMAVVVWEQAGRTANANVQTDMLRIPLAPAVYFVSAMCAVACIAIVVRMLMPRQVASKAPPA